STQRNLYVSRLFLISLVLWIDKPWGNTLREKLHEPCACGIQIGALRSVNKLFWRRCRGTIDLRSNLTCIRKYFFSLNFLFDLFRSLIFLCAKKTDLFHENQSNLEFTLFCFIFLLCFRSCIFIFYISYIFFFFFSLTPNRRWAGASPTNPKILWMIQKHFTGKGDAKHDQGSWN